jgi:hypothetical protein
LIIAHPGHELRVHGWLERERPVVFVLTDGSGHEGVPRVSSTRSVITRAGAIPGPVLGRFSDREVYEVILDGRIDPLAEVVDTIAGVLAELEIECVAGDAIEGFNPSHDLCRVVADAAVREASVRTGRVIAAYDFPLEGRPDACQAVGCLRCELDESELARKLEAAHNYPEMAGEVERAIGLYGVEPFRVECLRPVDPESDLETLFDEPPFYERHGEQQVAAGHYSQVLRFREHFLPLARSLRSLVRGRARPGHRPGPAGPCSGALRGEGPPRK